MPFYDGRIISDPEVSRRLMDTLFGPVTIQDVTLELDNSDGVLSSDMRGVPFTLDLYNLAVGSALTVGTFIVSQLSRSRGRATVVGTNMDLSALETLLPVGLISLTDYPRAVDTGKPIPWVWGQVRNLPAIYINRDVVKNRFDYVLNRGTAAAIVGGRRVTPGGIAPAEELGTTPTSLDGYIELEPFPGMDGCLLNGGLEDWDSGPTTNPTSWTLNGPGSVAKTTAAGQFIEGSAAAIVTGVAGGNTTLRQSLSGNSVALVPLMWWQGRTFTLTAWAWCATPAVAILRVTDGTGVAFDSAAHPGDSAWHQLSVTAFIDPAGFGATIQLRIAAGAFTVIWDDVEVQLKAQAWHEVLRTDLYLGYTAIRFFQQQTDTNGSPFQIAMDVNGLMAERNLGRAVRTLLSDPTHGLAVAVDAMSLDAAEINTTTSYDAAVLLDAPQVYWNFREPQTSGGPFLGYAQDRSGHARNGLVARPGLLTFYRTGGPTGESNDPYLDLGSMAYAYIQHPYNGPTGLPVYDIHAEYLQATGVTLEAWVWVDNITAPGATHIITLLEQRLSAAAFSGPALRQTASALTFSVVCGGTPFTLNATLIVNDQQRWLHVVATAGNGVLLVYVDGAVRATGAYTGSLDTTRSAGAFLLAGRYDTGDTSNNRLARVALYNTTLPAARALAHYNAMPLDVEPIDYYDRAILKSTTQFYYRFSETDSLSATDSSNVAGAGDYVNSPLWGTRGWAQTDRGPLPFERGPVNQQGALRMQNDLTKYAVKTGMTLATSVGQLDLWYRPAALNVNAGIVEKTIGGNRDTQWSVCQRAGGGNYGKILVTLVTSAGTFTTNLLLAQEDLGRWMWLSVSWELGVLRLNKNGVLAASTTYTGTPVSGVGDCYFGIQGAAGGALTRAGQGDIGRVSFATSTWSQDQLSALYATATWYNAGLWVDLAMTEQRQAQEWLRQLLWMQGLRLSVATSGAWTVIADTPGTQPALGTNLHLDVWSGGAAVAPDGFTGPVAVATGLPSGSVAKDTVNVHGGVASAAITRAGADNLLYQDLHLVDTVNFPLTWWIGRVVILRGWVRVPVGGVSASVSLTDGAHSSTVIVAATGVFMPVLLGLLVSLTATQVRMQFTALTANGTVQFDDLQVVVPSAVAVPTLALRDGLGDGPGPNLLECTNRQRPSLQDAVRDLVLQYRKDLVTGEYLCTQRFAITQQTNAAGARIGQDLVVEAEALRSDGAASRAGEYRAAYLRADETVEVTVEPVDALPLFEAMRLSLTDASVGYTGDIMIIREMRKRLRSTDLVLGQDPQAAYVYSPDAVPLAPGAEA